MENFKKIINSLLSITIILNLITLLIMGFNGSGDIEIIKQMLSAILGIIIYKL